MENLRIAAKFFLVQTCWFNCFSLFLGKFHESNETFKNHSVKSFFYELADKANNRRSFPFEKYGKLEVT